MSKLVLFLADGTTLDIKLERERLMIGRRPDNDVCLPYPAVSGEHAAIVTILDDSFLEDQGSTNGTLVNGRPVTKHFLRDRDQIDIGRQRLVYVVDEKVKLEPPRAGLARADDRGLGERVGESKRPRVSGAAVAAAVAAAAVAAAKTTPIARAPGLRPDAPAPLPPARPLRPEPRPAALAPAPALTPTPAPTPPAAAVAPAPVQAPVPVIRVLTGANAGRSLPLTKEETLVGRAGLQVAALRRTPDGVFLVPVEGERAPVVNGTTAQPGGTPVKTGDIVEIAGARLELMAPESPAGA
jgi:predicted component of type VI protein secretion system